LRAREIANRDGIQSVSLVRLRSEVLGQRVSEILDEQEPTLARLG